MKKVTVAIPTLNNERDIETCLKALQNQTFKDFDILFVDGYSKDKTVEIGKKYGARIVYDSGHTRAHACNTALKNVDSEFIVFTDADCIPNNDWLEKLLMTFNDKNVASVGGPNIGPEEDPSFAKSVDIAYASKIMTGNARYGMVLDNVMEANHNPGCNVAYRMEIAKKFCFDDELPTAEDVAFDYKIREAGYKIIFTPYAVVWHKRRSMLKEYWKQVYRYGLGRSLANKKYPKLRYWYHPTPTIAIFAFLLLIIFSAPPCILFHTFFPLYLLIFLLLIYFLLCIYGAATSYSRFKKTKYILMAALLIPIGQLAWGFGYLTGLCRRR